MCKRAGLLATQGIRGGANREVLKRIKESGDIFFAVSDREWVLDGANVHISMIGFDSGDEKLRTLDGAAVESINPNLTVSCDTTRAKRLRENKGISFMGDTKGGAFDISEAQALDFLSQPNPHGKPNSDVVVPWVNGMDLTQRPSGTWIVDYGISMEESKAALYETVFAYVLEKVKPQRDKSRTTISEWWLHERRREDMRLAIKPLDRFIGTTAVSKHRLFVWMTAPTLPDHAVFVFARSDDYFFGVLHSRIHEVWARAQGTQLRERESGFRYTPTTCFETFPLPKPTPNQEKAIGDAAKELDALRNNWLNPPEWTKEEVLEFPGSIAGPWARHIVPCEGSLSPSQGSSAPGSAAGQPCEGVNEPSQGAQIGAVRYPRIVPKDEDSAKSLAKRTLTNLYNARPDWLKLAHQKLDEAVFAAYGWSPSLTDEQLLENLLALNRQRAAEVYPGRVD